MSFILREFFWAATFSKFTCIFTFLHRSNPDYNWQHAANSFLRNEEHFNSWRNSLHCTKSEGSYRVQKNMYCLYPELDQSNPCPKPTSRRYIVISSYLCFRLPSRLFLTDFLARTSIHLWQPTNVSQVLPIPFFLTWSLVWSRVPLLSTQSSPDFRLSTELSQPGFFPHCETVSFTHPQNIMQSHSSAYFNVHNIGNRLEGETAWTEYQ